jgi:hypothetical protein
LSSNRISTIKIVFVKPMKVEESLGEGKPTIASIHQGKEGKKNYIESHASYPKPRVMLPLKKLPSQRFVPACYHRGKVGHIRPHCFNLKPHVHINENFHSKKESEGLVVMMREMLSRLDKFEQTHKSRTKISQVWVRKDDTIHPLRGSGGDFTLC